LPSSKARGGITEDVSRVAIYHLAAKPISRGAGRSVVACAAYRAAEMIHDERQGLTHDYTRKRGVEFAGIFAPQDAPAWTQDRAALWNTVEETEKRKDARLARELELALPHELDAQHRRYLVQDFIKENFTRKGFLCDVAIHAPDRQGDERNYHAHVLVTERTLSADGFARTKDRTQNETATLEHWRERWAEHGARHLARAGFDQEAERFRHGHQTLEEQRAAALARGDLEHAEALDREATQKLGEAATSLERRGIETDRGDKNRAIEARNEERAALRAAMREAAAEMERPPEAPRPMTPEDHAAAIKSRGDAAAARWLDKFTPRADLREGFAAAKDEATDRQQGERSDDAQKGKETHGTTADLAAEYIRTCQDPMRHLRRWLDEDGPRRAGSDFLPSRPFASLAGVDGLRPLRNEAHDATPEAVRDAPEPSPFAALPPEALDRATEAHRDEDKGRTEAEDADRQRKAKEDADRAAFLAEFDRRREEARKREEAEKAQGKTRTRSKDF
jgi:hypothetical protein